MKKISFWVLLTVLILGMVACSKDSSFNITNTQSSKGGSLARFVTIGNWLYTINSHSLRTYNISNVSNPKLTSELRVGPGIETLFPYKNNLFVGSNQALYVYQLNNPGKPAAVSSVSYVFRGRDPVVANDRMVFSTVRNLNNTGGVLNILDIRQVANPTLRNTIPMQEPYGLGLSGNTLFVCEGTYGFKSYEISNSPDSIGVIKQIGQVVNGDKFLDVIPAYPLLITYIQGGFSIYQISDPAKPRFISETIY